MVWPFSRKKKPAETKQTTAGAGALPRPSSSPTEADLAIIDDCASWLRAADATLGLEPKPDVGHLHVGESPGNGLAPGAPCGAVLKAKKGKLSWVDLYDPTLRPHIDALVKHLDKQQRWYFNGVIATKYDEKLAAKQR